MYGDFGESSIERYQRVEKIGTGTYGVVYKAVDTSNTHEERYVAIKKILLELRDEGLPSTAIREICILRELDSPYIVKLTDLVMTESKLYLVFEFLDQDLKQYIEKFPKKEFLDMETIRSFLYQMLQGILCCHSNRMIHRDLKPQNLLLDSAGTLKIADFGLARAF